MSEVKKQRKVRLNKMEVVKSPVENEVKVECEIKEQEQPKQKMIKGMSVKEYNSEYMYRYKLVKGLSNEDLLAKKQLYLKRIGYIDDELKTRELEEQNKQVEIKKLKSVSDVYEKEYEKVKKLYSKMKDVFTKINFNMDVEENI